jgi:N-acetylneuraminate synthase
MSQRTFIIAEAGVNHGGSIEQAMALVDVAADSGADAVKFQTFQAAQLATADAVKASYQVRNGAEGDSQQAMLQQLELSRADHERIKRHCRDREIEFMSTAFDLDSLAFLVELGVPALKIPSGDLTCAPLLLQAARCQLPMVVSTGMSTLADVENALGVLAFGLTRSTAPAGKADFARAYQSEPGQAALGRLVTLLHCVTQYPAAPESVNLRAMDTLTATFGLKVGYSDHTLGIEVSLAAVARGASVIEKHFTLSRGLPGPDHAASLEPAELRQLVAGIRTIETALGGPLKRPAPQELENLPIARRSLVASCDIAAGEVFTEANLGYKRPGIGISPMDYWDVLGRPAARRYAADELIKH